jgi:hypothetical protein
MGNCISTQPMNAAAKAIGRAAAAPLRAASRAWHSVAAERHAAPRDAERASACRPKRLAAAPGAA